MGTVTIEDVTISFDVRGEGDPILLIHGFASNRTVNWENTGWYKYFLSSGRRIVALDLRGHGQSQKLHGIEEYRPEKITRDILGLMDHLGITQTDIMGYSMGGWLSMHLLAMAPARFRAGVLGGVGDDLLTLTGRAESIARALTTQRPESITLPTLRTIREFAEVLNNDLRALAACNRGVYAGGVPPMERIPHPVLIVGGDKDDFVGLPHELAKQIPNATMEILRDRDHLTLLTAKRFKEAVGDFFARQDQ